MENSIKCLIEIKINKIKDGILLFNQNENNKEEIKDNYKVYLNNKKIQLNNLGNKYIINKNNFQKDGEYEIKISFNNKITNLTSFFEDYKK